jgi:hypothetical protein
MQKQQFLLRQKFQRQSAVLTPKFIMFLRTPLKDLGFLCAASHGWYYKRNRPAQRTGLFRRDVKLEYVILRNHRWYIQIGNHTDHQGNDGKD